MYLNVICIAKVPMSGATVAKKEITLFDDNLTIEESQIISASDTKKDMIISKKATKAYSYHHLLIESMWVKDFEKKEGVFIIRNYEDYQALDDKYKKHVFSGHPFPAPLSDDDFSETK